MEQGPKKIIACPSCNARQPIQPICEKCGFDIKSYVLSKHRADAQGSGAERASSSSAGGPPRQPPPPRNARDEGGIEWLFGTTWDIYKRRWLLLLGVIFGGSLAAIACMGILGGIWYALALLVPFPTVVKIALAGIGVIAGVVIATALWGWCLGAMFEAAADEQVGFMLAFDLARRKLWAYVWLLSLIAYMIMGGYILLLIPGIIFIVWFWYAPYVLALEGTGGMTAMVRSREYVRGQWWSTFLRLLLLMLCQLGLNIIPIAGPVLGLAFMPFTMIYAGQAYRNGKRAHPDVEWRVATSSEKTRYMILGSAGYVIAIAVAALLLAGAVKHSGLSVQGILDMAKSMNIGSMKQGAQSMPALPNMPGGSIWRSEDGSTAGINEYDRLQGRWDGEMAGSGGGQWSFTFMPGQNAQVTSPDGSVYMAKLGVFFDLGSKPGEDIKVPPGAGLMDYRILAAHDSSAMGKVSLGIYKFDSGMLTICASKPGVEVRPESWEPTPRIQCFELQKAGDIATPQPPAGQAPEQQQAESGTPMPPTDSTVESVATGQAVITIDGVTETYPLKTGLLSSTALANPSRAKLVFQFPGDGNSNSRRVEVELDATRSGIHSVDGEAMRKSWMSTDILPVGTLTSTGIAAKVSYIADGGQVFFPVGTCTLMVGSPYTARPESVLSADLGTCTFNSAGVEKHVERISFAVNGRSER